MPKMVESPLAQTGIAGLDDILRGGLPRGHVYLVEGDPGSGKTTLALQLLLDGARRGERGVYVTLSETKAELMTVAASHGWSLDGIEVFELPVPDALSGEDQNTLFHPAEVELAEVTKAVTSVCTRVNPHRVVFDSLSEIRLLAQSPLRYRREVLALKQYFVGRQATVLLLDDRTTPDPDLQLQSIAHGVITLDQRAPLYGAQRRRIRVLKLRGVDYKGGYHDCCIERGGLLVFPRLIASEHTHSFEPGTVSSGLEGLDQMLGGGIDRGTSLLLLGPPGTGKSALATQWAAASAMRREKAAIFCFDETAGVYRTRAATLGTDLSAPPYSQLMHVRQIDPAEVPPGHFAATVRDAVEVHGTRCVVIDSLNGYVHAMPEESFLVLQLHELLTYLAQRGVVTILVMAQHGLVGTMASPIDVSYLADSVIVLRHFEAGGTLRRAISVLKKRTGPHERAIRELRMGKDGIMLGEPLTKFRGVLTGVPQYEGTVEDLFDRDDI
ncbi:MAG TPA: ATPase domain-containing protein [Polyangia bacterium]|nr:ATPase domain-containing protein [Polyangia bacterium]